MKYETARAILARRAAHKDALEKANAVMAGQDHPRHRVLAEMPPRMPEAVHEIGEELDRAEAVTDWLHRGMKWALVIVCGFAIGGIIATGGVTPW